ncbi:unnamed protein product [Polarella glacialis]|uniref:Uncharacterized protein n=1 Tax=Polarella glacialis TaxID=89957 RepID=A0A813FBW2_POLGL|nr:unnamed protein product [Polarella glacialis]
MGALDSFYILSISVLGYCCDASVCRHKGPGEEKLGNNTSQLLRRRILTPGMSEWVLYMLMLRFCFWIAVVVVVVVVVVVCVVAVVVVVVLVAILAAVQARCRWW